jgi:hypothetical protein
MCPSGTSCRLDYPDVAYRCLYGTLGEACFGDSCFNIDSQGTLLGDVYLDLTEEYQVCSSATQTCRTDDNNRIPGDFCSQDAQCRAPAGSVVGFCDSETGRCLGSSVTNGTCNVQQDCDVGTFCNFNTQLCQAIDQTGGCPEGQSAQCADKATFCVNSVCTPAFSVDFGGECNGEDWVCLEGMTCTGGGCRDTRSVTDIIGLNCTDDDGTPDGSRCPSPLQCTCSDGKGDWTCQIDNIVRFTNFYELNPNRCIDNFRGYLDCLTENECHRSSDPQLDNSCANAECYGAWEDSLNCYFDDRSADLETSGDLTGSCLFSTAAASQLASIF